MWNFADHNPGTAFLMMFLIVLLVRSIYKSTMRHLNIRKAGWPPSHCDANGEFCSCDCDEEEG